MIKKYRAITATALSVATLMPNIAVVAEAQTTDASKADENTTTGRIENVKENANSEIDIKFDRTSIVLGMKSGASVKFKEKPDADSITLDFLCVDVEQDATLKYNPTTDAYEGEIFYHKDPQELNVWKLEDIKINNDAGEVLTKEDLESKGVDLKSLDVTQEVIMDTITPETLKAYTAKTAAPKATLAGANRYETAVAISKEAYPNGTKTVILVNGAKSSDGVGATPLASTYDAPILLSEKDKLPASTKAELQRLKPSRIVVIGDATSVSEKVVNAAKSAVSGLTSSRIGGKDRLETSLLIAKELDKDHDVTKVYIANGYKGEFDALNIAAKAGEEKQPIILVDKESIPSGTYEWLKGENLTTGYFIGGENSISVDVIHRMADITPKHESDPENSIYKHRIYGVDRHETNAKVMSYFYPQADYNSVLVCKSDVIVDALAAGTLAAKQKSPIMITPKNSVSAYHNDNLNSKKANKVYQIGEGLTSNVMNTIAERMSEHNTTPSEPGAQAKTVVIDPGHGGKDSGACATIDGVSYREEALTLKTSLATTEYLRQHGVNVVMTRTSNVWLDLVPRAEISNKIGPNLFTSIHYNSFEGSKNNYSGASGTEVFYNLRDKNGGFSKTAANNVINQIISEFGFVNRGIKTKESGTSPGKDYLSVLRNTNAPAILVECAFVDNREDMKKLNTNDKINKLGQKIGEGIVNTLK
ncbi:MAG: N-acetylmuramoyl-L-alanine amidase [Clostridioides sp.]|jgi:N-acetylmuramoyl-L-alanine amidase|nr:N-acetylmuramoyl-L-alanine amidase [Clostridioides sp.]